MRLSIVIPVYQSHEIVRRQALWLARMRLPLDVECVFVDDGSCPALRAEDYDLPNLYVCATGNRLAWTQGLARNLGAEKATGAYLLMTDIDHILSHEAILAARAYAGPKMIFRRQLAILDSDGKLTQDRAALAAWGCDRADLHASVHGNTFAMPRADFLALGGYDPATCSWGYHPVAKHGDDCYFNRKWNRAHRGAQPDVGPDIYLFPTGRFHKDGCLNPHGLFHDLHQRQEAAHKGEEVTHGG
jgi:hypothetical protein